MAGCFAFGRCFSILRAVLGCRGVARACSAQAKNGCRFSRMWRCEWRCEWCQCTQLSILDIILCVVEKVLDFCANRLPVWDPSGRRSGLQASVSLLCESPNRRPSASQQLASCCFLAHYLSVHLPWALGRCAPSAALARRQFSFLFFLFLSSFLPLSPPFSPSPLVSQHGKTAGHGSYLML